MITLEGSRDWTVTSVFFFQAAMKSGVLQILEGKGGTLQASQAVAFILHTPWLGRPSPPRGGFTLIFTWCKPCSQLPGSRFSGVGCYGSWEMRLDKIPATTLSHQSSFFFFFITPRGSVGVLPAFSG